MSSRAIRRLRQDQLFRNEEVIEEDDNDSDEENDDDLNVPKHQTNFAMFDDDSDSSSEEEEEEEEEEEKEEEEKEEEEKEDNDADHPKKETDISKNIPKNEEEDAEEEDIDQILNEFHETSLKSNSTKSSSTNPFLSSKVMKSKPNLLLENIDSRHLDMEYSMRTMLGAEGIDHGPAAAAAGFAGVAAGIGVASNVKNSRKPALFPLPNWMHQHPPDMNQNNPPPRNNRRHHHARKTPKPPHFMGGGLGIQILSISKHITDYVSEPMATHDDNAADANSAAVDANANSDANANANADADASADTNALDTKWQVPFPYNMDSALQLNPLPNHPILHCDPQNSDDQPNNNETNNNPPFSYQNQIWYTFHPSKTYQQIQNRYNTFMTQMTSYADANILTMFVADHPFYAPAALQLALLFFQTLGNTDKGIEMLKRCLCIWEYASGSTIAIHDTNGGGGGGSAAGIGNTRNMGHLNLPELLPNATKQAHLQIHALMDKSNENENSNDENRGENECFFEALFRYMQTSCMVGCLQTSLAIARFLLSLDPLRDPMGVLLTMDYYALASVNDTNTQFLIDLVQSNMIQIHYLDPFDNHHICHLLDMPNWSYHYALALRRREQQQQQQQEPCDNQTSLPTSSDDALQAAILSHPSILPLLLEKNQIDIKSRSFRTDWPSVLPILQQFVTTHEREMANAAISTEGWSTMSFEGYHKVVSIFIQRSYKLWCADDTISWLYKNCKHVMDTTEGKVPPPPSSTAPSNPEPNTQYTLSSPKATTVTFIPSIALNRYSTCNPQDYMDRYQMLPGDGNFLDENLVAMAMEYNPQRRPLLRHLEQQHREQERRQRRNQGGNGNEEEVDLQQMLLNHFQRQRNGGGQTMTNLNPDAPLLELYFRSMMPWAQVQGVPRGGRR